MSSQSQNSYQWLPGAIFPPELDWLKTNIEEIDIDILIECGRQDGASARWFYENLRNVKLYSIDLDDRPDVLENSINNLLGTDVESVTGDVFEMVPEIIRANPTKRIGIIEDAVKGWPGLCLLMSSVFYDNVVLVAQHNLHEGHKTKSFWNRIGRNKVFLESSTDQEMAYSLRKWTQDNEHLANISNRDIDMSSLAVMQITTQKRMQILDTLFNSKHIFGHWDPVQFRRAHGGQEASFVKNNFKKEYYLRFMRKKR